MNMLFRMERLFSKFEVLNKMSTLLIKLAFARVVFHSADAGVGWRAIS